MIPLKAETASSWKTMSAIFFGRLVREGLLFLDPGLRVPVVGLGLFDVHLVSGARSSLKIVHHGLLNFTDSQITALVYYRLRIRNTNPANRFRDSRT